MTDLEQAPVTEHPERADQSDSAEPSDRAARGEHGGRADGDGRTDEAPAARRRHRWLTAIVVFLLIAIPAGYLVISAEQSRDSGQNKEEEASATGLTWGWPSKVQRRIYNVPIPGYSRPVYYFETNSFDTSSLYVQFRTSQEGLDRFLAHYGLTRDDLEQGKPSITPKQAARVDWDFTVGGPYAGVVHRQQQPRPTERITVKYATDGHPVVYVLSTTKF